MSEDQVWARLAETTTAADAAAVARADRAGRTRLMTGAAERAAQAQANQVLEAEIRRRAEARGLVWDPASGQWVSGS